MTNVKVAERSGREVGGVKLRLRAEVVEALIEAHAEEFHAALAARYAEAGLTYERPLSPEEKAAQKERAAFEKARAEFEALVAKYPSLAARSVAAVAIEAEPFDADDLDAPAEVDLGIDPALSRA